METGRDSIAAARGRARRRRVLVAVVAVLILIPTVTMVVVNHLTTPAPPPLWTEEALPIPAEEDNGWPLIAHYTSMTISGVNLDPIDKLLDLSRSGTPLSELGRQLAPARAVAAVIGPHTKICAEAFARERMVLPCLSLEARECTTEPLEICTRLATFAALDDAARGSRRATSRMIDVLRQLTDAAANSRHPSVQARCLQLLRQAVHHAAAIIRWRTVDSRPLREALQTISDESLPVRHAVIASYLLKLAVLRQAFERTDTWLLDEGAVLREFNAPFEATAKGGPLPPPGDHTEGWFWWFRNPIGKRMLDAVQPGADAEFQKALELRTSVMTRRDEALALK